jgi:CRP-like cAMP-binding protein
MSALQAQLNKIQTYLQFLDGPTSSVLASISKSHTFQKGEYLLRAGEVCRASFWLQAGVARKFYLNDGKEITTEFYFTDDLAVAFEAYALQSPSREFIQALSEVQVSVTNYYDFEQAKRKFPQLLQLDLLLTEYQVLWLEERLFRFHTSDAREHYQYLLQQSPQLLQVVQLTHISSYLGISLETLSRIRSKK